MRMLFVAAALLLFSSAGFAACIGSGSFYTCNDASGNNYTVTRMGNMTTVQGNNATTGSQWNETSQRLGNMTVTNGTTNGRPWNETQTNVGGGNVMVNGMNSHGQPYSYTCNPATGCR